MSSCNIVRKVNLQIVSWSISHQILVNISSIVISQQNRSESLLRSFYLKPYMRYVYMSTVCKRYLNPQKCHLSYWRSLFLAVLLVHLYLVNFVWSFDILGRLLDVNVVHFNFICNYLAIFYLMNIRIPSFTIFREYLFNVVVPFADNESTPGLFWQISIMQFV